MKSAIIALSALAAVVAAQDPSGLAACAQTCVNNMLSAEKAQELGCQQNDIKCLCANVNFTYGLRDCSAAICSSDDARKVVEYGISVCRGAGVAITTGSGNGGSGGGTQTFTGTSPTGTDGSGNGGGGAGGSVSTIYNTLTSDGSVITTPIATTTFTAPGSGSGGTGHVSTFTSVFTGEDGKPTTSIIETTIAGGAGQVSSFTTVITGEDGKPTTSVGETTLTGSGEETATATGTDGAGETGSVVFTTLTSGGSVVTEPVTTVLPTDDGSATATETGGEATKTGSGSSSTSTAGASMPQVTAAPVGIIAAAGLALLML